MYDLQMTAQQALNNVHAKWINEAVSKYPKEIESLDEEINKVSTTGNRSIRIENFLNNNYFIVPKEYDLITLKRYFIAKGFEITEDAGVFEGKYYKHSYISW